MLRRFNWDLRYKSSFSQFPLRCFNRINPHIVRPQQLNGPDAEAVAPSDADILLTLLGAELDNDAFLVDGTSFPNALPSSDEIQPMNIVSDEQAEPTPPPNAVSSAVVPIDHFTRGLENFLQQRVMLLTLGEINGFASKNAVDRFLNRDHQSYGQRTVSQDGLESALFGTSQLEVGGQMDNSLYDTTAPDALSHTAHLNDTSDLHAMFVSSVTTHRPNSQPEDFPHQSTMGSTAPRMRLENNANFYASQSEKDILPPLRLGRMLRKQRKDQGLSLGKKHFTKAGFDASFTRATPRVLQNKATVGKDFALGGGATEAEIEALRWELTVAREGIKHLDKMVDTNIAWVQSNCDMTGLAVNFSDRTKQKCRKMATERIVAVYVNLAENTQYWAMRRWQTAVRFDRLSTTVKKYSKLKGIEILTNTLWKAITNQLYNRGWRPWLRFVQAQILAKMNKAAIQIQRIARGRQGRVRFEKKKLGQVAITLQKLFRKTKAVQVIKEKRFVREQEMNNVAVRAIQKLLKKLINIRRAKAEANQRRMDRASIRIQKIHRGRQGRKEFLQKFLKKNHAEREDLDLELLAVAASKSASRDAADMQKSASTQEVALSPDVDTTHDPRKRSLFHKTHAPSSQMAASASPSTTSSAAATPRSKHAVATGKGQVDKNATPGSTRKAPNNLSQPKHRHESPNPVRASDKGDEKSHRSVRSGAPKVTNKRSVRSPPRSPAPPSAPAPIDENKPLVLKISTSRPSSKDSSPVPSRPPSGRASIAVEAKDSSGKKLSSRPTSRADSPVNNALNASLLEYAHEEEESLAGDAILIEDDASVASVTSVKTNQSTARAQSKPSKPSPSSEADNSAGARPRIRGGNSADNESTLPSNVRGAAGARGGKTSTRIAAATSTKSSVRNPKSTRVAANVTPAAAAANIQKVARGKLARQLSKKLMEGKDVVPDESAAPADPQEATSEAAVPEQPVFDVPAVEEEPLRLDLTEQAGPTETPAHAEDANDGAASAAPDHTQDVYTDYGISASPSRDFSTTAGSRPNSSRQSILSMLPTSILTGFQIPKFGSSVSPKDRPRSGSSFRFPGFSHKSDTESVGSANSVPPSPVNGDRPRSSTFFRNPFTGWSSRENTPSRTRPTGEGFESNSISFGHHPNVIREEVVRFFLPHLFCFKLTRFYLLYFAGGGHSQTRSRCKENPITRPRDSRPQACGSDQRRKRKSSGAGGCRSCRSCRNGRRRPSRFGNGTASHGDTSREVEGQVCDCVGDCFGPHGGPEKCTGQTRLRDGWNPCHRWLGAPRFDEQK